MSRSFSLEGLSTYMTEQVGKIGAVRKEVEEIQVGFNSAYVEWKAEHDATLESLTEAMVDRLEGVGPDLELRISERNIEERRIIGTRREELRTNSSPRPKPRPIRPW